MVGRDLRARPTCFFICTAGAVSEVAEPSGMGIGTTPPVQTQPEPAAPRIVRIISEDENIASTRYYVAPLETIILPETRRTPIPFYAIDKFSQSLKWPPLREVGVPEGGLEVRVWINVGALDWPQALRLFIMRINGRDFMLAWVSSMMNSFVTTMKSKRNMILITLHGDLQKTATEMGHYENVQTTLEHYRGLTTKRDAEAFWVLRPKG